MVRLIDAHPGVSVSELAKHFGRAPSSIRMDVNLLDQAGVGELLPGETFDIDYELFTREDRVALRVPLALNGPLPLTKSEISALTVALGVIAPTLDEDELEILPGALSALISGHEGEFESAAAEVLPTMPPATVQKIGQIQEALETGTAIALEYVDAAGVPSQRVVNPETLTCEVDGWVMSGWCYKAKAHRSFRLDRVIRLSIAEKPQGDRPARSRRRSRNDGQQVEVLLRPGASWALADSAAKRIQDNPDGTIVATYQVWDPLWFRTELLSLAPHVIATEPAHYFETAATFARHALERRSTTVASSAPGWAQTDWNQKS